MTWPRWWLSPSSSEKAEQAPSNSISGRIEQTARDSLGTVEQKVHSATSNLTTNGNSTRNVFTEPQTIAATIILTLASLGCFRLYKTYFRRIPEATNIPPSYLRKRSILGKVTSVGDGDNFRIYHTPGGRLAGWGWLPGRRIPTNKKLLKNNTIHIRIAGVDAPEMAHFGRPGQPYSKEALDWLTSYLIGRRVRAYVHKADQYSRVVATVYVRKGLLRRDVGLQMLRSGLATVYEAKSGAEFGEGLEPKYRSAEKWARLKRKGMWAGNMANYESPREYKSKYAGSDSTDRT